MAQYTPITPVRAADTRREVAIAARGVRRVRVLGVGEVPGSGVDAVMINLTVAGAPQAGYFTVWGEGAQPATSNLNFTTGENAAAAAICSVAADGTIAIFNGCHQHAAHAVVDVVGWFGSAGSKYTPLEPVRLLDTREGGQMVRGGDDHRVRVAGRAGVPAGATGAIVNVTVVGADTDSYVTTYPSGGQRPLASTINYRAGEVRANLAAVKLGEGGAFSLTPHTGAVHLICDLLGYFDERGATEFIACPPVRAYDSRDAPGDDRLRPREVVDVPFARVAGVAADARAVAVNITVVDPTELTYVATYPSGRPAPTVSTVNVGPQPGAPGRAMCNNTFITLDAHGYGAVRNWAGSPHIIVDVVGYLR